MRIIHGQGYSDEDRKTFRVLVFENVHKVIRTLCEQMDNLQIEYDKEINAVSRLPPVPLPVLCEFVCVFVCTLFVSMPVCLSVCLILSEASISAFPRGFLIQV